MRVFSKTKKLQVPEFVNIAKIKSQESERALTPLKALKDTKQGWHYAEVLHLETGLQDTSLQSQQGARSLALPDSASARKY